jgi:hypothetical protein
MRRLVVGVAEKNAKKQRSLQRRCGKVRRGRAVDLEDGRRTADLLFVATQHAEIFHRANVKHAHRLIARRASDHIASRRPCKCLDCVLVCAAVSDAMIRHRFDVGEWSSRNLESSRVGVRTVDFDSGQAGVRTKKRTYKRSNAQSRECSARSRIPKFDLVVLASRNE